MTKKEAYLDSFEKDKLLPLLGDLKNKKCWMWGRGLGGWRCVWLNGGCDGVGCVGAMLEEIKRN